MLQLTVTVSVMNNLTSLASHTLRTIPLFAKGVACETIMNNQCSSFSPLENYVRDLKRSENSNIRCTNFASSVITQPPQVVSRGHTQRSKCHKYEIG